MALVGEADDELLLADVTALVDRAEVGVEPLVRVVLEVIDGLEALEDTRDELIIDERLAVVI